MPEKLKTIRRSEQTPQLTVVFVHGLDGDWLKTWRNSALSEEDKFGWPEWLGRDLEAEGIPNEILALDYPAASTSWRGSTLPMLDRADNFLENLDLTLEDTETPLLFICHSLGGLVVKKLLSIARAKTGTKQQFLDRTRGVLFLGTPHDGSGIPNIVLTLLPKLISKPTITLDELEKNDPELRELKAVFLKEANDRDWNVRQFGEGQKTGKFGLKTPIKVVDENSAHSGVGEPPVIEDADHIDLPKCADRHSNIYRRALAMCREMVNQFEEMLEQDVMEKSASDDPTPEESPANLVAENKTDVPVNQSDSVESVSANLDSTTIFEKTIKALESVFSEARDANESLYANPLATIARQFRATGVIHTLVPATCEESFDLPGFLDEVLTGLEGIQPRTVNLTAEDLRRVELMIGGFIVLGAEPEWTTKNREVIAGAAIRCPAVDLEAPKANFLAIVSAVLTDSLCRVGEVFDDSPVKYQKLRTFETTTADRLTGVRLDLIKRLYPEQWKNTFQEGRGPHGKSSDERARFIQEWFDTHVRPQMRRVRRRGDPFTLLIDTGDDSRNFEVAALIKGKENLAVEDLVAIVPHFDEERIMKFPGGDFLLPLSDIHDRLEELRNRI